MEADAKLKFSNKSPAKKAIFPKTRKFWLTPGKKRLEAYTKHLLDLKRHLIDYRQAYDDYDSIVQ